MKYGEFNDYRKEINQKRRARDLHRGFEDSSSDSYDDEGDSSDGKDFKVRKKNDRRDRSKGKK